jgi:hypothetical protein
MLPKDKIISGIARSKGRRQDVRLGVKMIVTRSFYANLGDEILS